MNRIRVIIILLLESALIISACVFLKTYKETSLNDIKKAAQESMDKYIGDDKKNDVHHSNKMYVFNMTMDRNSEQLNTDGLTKQEIDKNQKYYEENLEEINPWSYDYNQYVLLKTVLKEYENEFADEYKFTTLDQFENYSNKFKGMKIRLIEVDGKKFYIKLCRNFIDKSFYDPEYVDVDSITEEELIESNKDSVYEVYYTNVTAQYKTVDEVSKTIVTAAIIIGIIGFICSLIVSFLLEKNERMQKRFFENTSHELKTPLASIKGYAEGIQMGVVDDVQKSGLIISKQTDKMTKLVEDILSVARLESGAVKLEKEVVDVSEFIQDCLMPYEGEVREKNLDVELDLDEVDVKIDSSQFEKAFANIISKTLEEAKSKVIIRNNKNIIEVWGDIDSYDSNDIKHMFDRFYVKSNGNTGIELALAKDIIGFHGFNIYAKSLNNGVDFSIDLRG